MNSDTLKQAAEVLASNQFDGQRLGPRCAEVSIRHDWRSKWPQQSGADMRLRHPPAITTDVAQLVRSALDAIEARFFTEAVALANPWLAAAYLRLQLGHRDRECFFVVFLDAQNRPIAADELFQGSLTQCAVYPRQIAHRALHHNAAGVILCHNHPSGVFSPSVADQTLTETISATLDLIEVRVLDHIIVSATGAYSMELKHELGGLH